MQVINEAMYIIYLQLIDYPCKINCKPSLNKYKIIHDKNLNQEMGNVENCNCWFYN